MNREFESERSEADVLRQIEERVRSRMAAVERQNEQLRSRTRLLGLGLLVTAAVLAVVAVAPDALSVVGLGGTGRTVEARSIRLIDADGTPRGEWGIDEDGRARFGLLDPQGRQRLNLAVLSDGAPGLYFTDRQGNRRVILGLLPEEATLVFADAQGNRRVVLGTTSEENRSFFTLHDATGSGRIGLGVDGSGVTSGLLPESAGEESDTDSGDPGS